MIEAHCHTPQAIPLSAELRNSIMVVDITPLSLSHLGRLVYLPGYLAIMVVFALD